MYPESGVHLTKDIISLNSHRTLRKRSPLVLKPSALKKKKTLKKLIALKLKKKLAAAAAALKLKKKLAAAAAALKKKIKLKKLKKKIKLKKLKKKLAAEAAAATTVTLASSGASFSGSLAVLGLQMIGASLFMAVSFFNAQNNQRRASDYGYGRSDYGYDKSDFGNNNNYQYADATAGKIVPYIESSDIRYNGSRIYGQLKLTIYPK